jgi:hypothetical protein
VINIIQYQPITGRYLSWIICLWNPEQQLSVENRNPNEPRLFFLYFLFQENLGLILPTYQRRIESTLVALKKSMQLHFYSF